MTEDLKHTKPPETVFVHSAIIRGVEAVPVTVEVSFSGAVPGITIVGMADQAVMESKTRIRQALRASGMDVPNKHIVINLTPSDEKKNGTGFDLPIALGILVISGTVDDSIIQNTLCIGELSLDGTIKPTGGFLAYENLAHQNNMRILSAQTESGVYSQSSVQHICAQSLSSIRNGEYSDPIARSKLNYADLLDYAEVANCEQAKRAMQIVATGGHSVLMMGPPGSGKSMMASRLPSILPALSSQMRIETALIHSVAGLNYDSILDGQMPFRSPHHSATRAGLLGGGSPIKPGEVSLAHNGILFLDEMPEFGPTVLQLLRQPIESGQVILSRAGASITFPAKFILVAAANPCPCGYYGDPDIKCKCSPNIISRYQSRIGGPIIDRIDLQVSVWRSDPASVLATGSGTSSAKLRAEVDKGLAFKAVRENRTKQQLQKTSDGQTASLNNSELTLLNQAADVRNKGAGELLIKECKLKQAETEFLLKAAKRFTLSGRAIMRSLSVARTIADLAEEPAVSTDHLLEALAYRTVAQ